MNRDVLTSPVIYECLGCGERQAGTRRCEDCNLFMRRIGPGGSCPHCDEPGSLTSCSTRQGRASERPGRPSGPAGPG